MKHIIPPFPQTIVHAAVKSALSDMVLPLKERSYTWRPILEVYRG